MKDLIKEKNKDDRKKFIVRLYVYPPRGVWLKTWYAIQTDWHDAGSGSPFDDDDLFNEYLKKYEWIKGEDWTGSTCYTWTGKEKELTLF